MGMATLRPKDGENPEKALWGSETAREDPAALQIPRARTCDMGMTRFPRLTEPRSHAPIRRDKASSRG